MQESFSIRQILFPTDFSRSSESVALHVAGLAEELSAKVRVLNVLPWLSGWHGASEPHFVVGDDVLRNLELTQHAMEASSLKMLEALKARWFQDVECEISTRTGGVADSVVEYAREIQADLIMMPTRGSGPPRPFLIGSVTAKVLHDARCPVWTSPHPKELEAFHPYRQVLCAMDYRVLSRDLLAQAATLAQFFRSRLSVVTAIPCPAASPIPCVERQSVRLLKDETGSALRDLLKALHVNASVHVLEGTVGETIRQAVAMEDADLVVIGRGHLEERAGHLRTHAYEIIWNSPCPVLTLYTGMCLSEKEAHPA